MSISAADLGVKRSGGSRTPRTSLPQKTRARTTSETDVNAAVRGHGFEFRWHARRSDEVYLCRRAGRKIKWSRWCEALFAMVQK
eukprot:4221975-Heterocapsa_arctica.AAC.1